VDHNLPQTDFRNADDHRFLRTVAARYGLYFSPPGNGISHQVHLERFSVPGQTLLGSDSHTPTAGGAGMLALGAGGLDVALALAGQPFYLIMPEILGVRLTGRLPDWVSAKDVILELLRRLTVKGGRGKILEFFGPALGRLTVPERAAITNMGAELGATTSIFPADEQTRKFLARQGREADFRPLRAQGRPSYAEVQELDLAGLTPLIAQPGSPDRVVPVKEVEGAPVEQVLIGSCANSSFRDLMVAARALRGRRVHPRVSLEVNPGSRQVLENLILAGGLLPLITAGARVMPPGCWGCIGMGQAPPTGAVSVRTFPRNFPGRSGTKDDQVYLASPETAVAAAIFGELRDPRSLGAYPRIAAPRHYHLGGDDILPAGSRILPLRSNLPAISQYAFTRLDPEFPQRVRGRGEGAVVGGENYGQGSSREHAALAPRYLGVRLKLVKSFARIHLANLINFGILPLTFENPQDYDLLTQGQVLELPGVQQRLLAGDERLTLKAGDKEIWVRVDLSARQRRLVAVGGALNLAREG
jgi:aconitate hydratase